MMRSLPRALAPSVLLLVALSAPRPTAAQPPTAGDPRRGAALFQQSCALCHATGTETRPAAGQGPLLAGVVGRPAASLPNFGYTKALEDSHLTWDPSTLDRFLTAPTTVVPGSAMVVPVANPADRTDLIAFLATLRAVAAPTNAERLAASSHARTPGDWQNDAPGARHRIRLEDLPAPYATKSVGNSPRTVARPEGAALAVPAGFQVKVFASGLSGPRLLRTAPNGDIFIAETGHGQIHILRAADGADAPSENRVFAKQLHGPFGIAF